MKLYGGIDLHSNNHVLVLIDEQDKIVYQKRLPNALDSTLSVLKPYRKRIVSLAVESTYNWYWLVDGLIDAQYSVRLVNTLAVKQYDGLKHQNDHTDAFHLAHLMRLGILPTGLYLTLKPHVAYVIYCVNACNWYNNTRCIYSVCKVI